jgi:hypothetical protein
MRKKPILIITGILAVAICSFLFIRSKYLVKPEKKEVIAFLEDFNINLKMSNTDTLLNYFEGKQSNKILIKLLGILSNKTGSDGKTKPLFEVALVPDEATIKTINPEITQATIPIIFVDSGNVKQRSSIQFKLRKIAAGHFKIIQFDGRSFIHDFIAYESKIRIKQTPPQDIYSAITLAAFKTAEKLKSRYDSVMWFEHIDNKTYFYVINGKWNNKTFWSDEIANDEDRAVTSKMGLVGPDLKEIIPPQYDLIHNIGGTVDSLIEVEKDDKKGLYNLAGKNIVSVDYDEILPLNKNEDNLAVLRKNDDYFYLKTDYSISGKISDFKIAEALPKIKNYNGSYTLSDSSSKNIMEDNSLDSFTSTVISPSYLVGWKILPRMLTFQNPLRKAPGHSEDEAEGSSYYDITFNGHVKGDNWFESVFHSIVDDYIGGRGGLYETKNVLLVDKKKNRVLAYATGTTPPESDEDGTLSEACNNDYLRSVNDSLFEYRTTYMPRQALYNDMTLAEAPNYCYLHIKNGKLEALPNKRVFGFTKYVKMNDSYLEGCYQLYIGNDYQNLKTIGHVTTEMLRYMKNEIYASYRYQFKDERWQDVFSDMVSAYDHGKQIPPNANVDDSLTVIDKYNINFINQKLNGVKSPPKVLAAK